MNLRSFGRTGNKVTPVGLGGEGILRTFGKTAGALDVISEALRQGITYFDSARAYAGSEGYYGSYWPEHLDQRYKIFQASKSASRDREGALTDLDITLITMGIEWLDLWQIHDIRTRDDLRMIESKGGALEAFVEAKETGKVRFIGVTGHHDPDILTHAVENWPVDAVLLPVNPVESLIGGFLNTTLPAAQEIGLAIIGMKILGASHYINQEMGVTADLLIRYALSQGITLANVGCSSPSEVKTLANAGLKFAPLSQENLEKLEEIFRPYARRLAFYRGAL